MEKINKKRQMRSIYPIILTFIILVKDTYSSENNEEISGTNGNLRFLPGSNTPSHTATEFDSYVLSIQFPKTQCFKFKNCEEKLRLIPKNTFTIHGLWPNLNGKPKEDCNIGDVIQVNFTDKKVEKQALTYWKSLKADDKSFWNHEYNKHGLCWNLRYEKKRPEEFFKLVLELYIKHDLNNIVKNAGFILDNSQKIQQ